MFHVKDAKEKDAKGAEKISLRPLREMGFKGSGHNAVIVFFDYL
jgi:hypothetical protein